MEWQIKERQGFIKEILDDHRTALCSGMFKKETDFSHFIGLPVISTSLPLSNSSSGFQVVTSNGSQGKLQKAHGNDGDFLVRFNSILTLSSQEDKRITLFSKKYVTH